MATESELLKVIRDQNIRISKLEDRLEEALFKIEKVVQGDMAPTDETAPEISPDPLSLPPPPHTSTTHDDSTVSNETNEQLDSMKPSPIRKILSSVRTLFALKEPDSFIPETHDSEDYQFEETMQSTSTSQDRSEEDNQDQDNNSLQSIDDYVTTFYSQPDMSSMNVELNELKANQKKLLKHFQNCNDSRDRRTLVVSNIGLEAWAEHLYKNNMDNWPFIKKQLMGRGLDFLLTDCVDMRMSKTGTLYVIFDRYYRVRQAKMELRWKVHSMKKIVEEGQPYTEDYEFLRKMKFSERTPARFNGTRRILQKMATDMKRKGLIDTFEFIINRSEAGDKKLLLRAWSKRTRKFYYFDTNKQIVPFHQMFDFPCKCCDTPLFENISNEP